MGLTSLTPDSRVGGALMNLIFEIDAIKNDKDKLEKQLESAREVIIDMSKPPYKDSNLQSLLDTLNGTAKKWLKDNEISR